MQQKASGKPRYEIFGPFSFQASAKIPHRKALKEFWEERAKDEKLKDLGSAVGVYVWTVKKRSRRVPWNVGLTDKQGFRDRFAQKENSFLKLLQKQRNPEIDVYLLALRSKTGKFKKQTKSQRIPANDWLETMLIGSSININPDLRNTAKAGYLKNAIVDGYLNDNKERRNEAARSFSALFKAQAGKRN